MIYRPVILAVDSSAPVRSPERAAAQRSRARDALAECAKACGAPVDGWKKNGGNAPVPNGEFHWSISHKPQWVAAVIADRPVGIDIEPIRARPRELHASLASDDEWKVLGDRSWSAFFYLWTAKEATLKANGGGIAGLLRCRLVEVSDDRHFRLEYRDRSWRVEHLQHTDHVAAVTCGDDPIEWCVLK